MSSVQLSLKQPGNSGAHTILYIHLRVWERRGQHAPASHISADQLLVIVSWLLETISKKVFGPISVVSPRCTSSPYVRMPVS